MRPNQTDKLLLSKGNIKKREREKERRKATIMGTYL